MGKFSEDLIFGMTIRESATDGSDFTNPPADYRRAFLGEDGQFHLKDSAGTVTDIGSGSGNVAADAIWDTAGDLVVGTGANTAAKLVKGAAGANLSSYNGVVAWNGGTSFPATPATGDRYWRSDLGMEFYYDGTRWLSTQLFTLPAPGIPLAGISASAGFTRSVAPPLLGGSDAYLVSVSCGFIVASGGTALSGSHKWEIVITKRFTGGSTDFVTVTINSGNSNEWRSSTTSVGALMNSGTTHHEIDTTAVKTGSPGNLTGSISLNYRIVAT